MCLTRICIENAARIHAEVESYYPYQQKLLQLFNSPCASEAHLGAHVYLSLISPASVALPEKSL